MFTDVTEVFQGCWLLCGVIITAQCQAECLKQISTDFSTPFGRRYAESFHMTGRRVVAERTSEMPKVRKEIM